MDKEINIKHLLSLADDPDESVWLSIRDSLFQLGSLNIELLKTHWKNCDNPTSANRIEELVIQINSNSLISEFSQWINQKNAPIITGVVLLSRILDPEFSENDLNKLFQPIQRNIWLELSNKLTALEKVRIINHLLFEKQSISFKPNLEARSIHFFLPTLLKTKVGHPLAITLLFILLARELDLALYKVSRGDLAALVYIDSPESLKIANPAQKEFTALFYILLDNQIEIFGKNQFVEYINHQFPTKNQDLSIVPDKKLVEIILLKLKFLYQEEKNTEKAKLISQILALFN